MTDVERGLVAKLQAQVTFIPGSSHKRFVLGLNEHSQLSEKGRNYLAYIANRYRRQWKASPDEFEWIVAWCAYGAVKI